MTSRKPNPYRFSIQVPRFVYPDGPRRFGKRDGWSEHTAAITLDDAKGRAEALVYQYADEARVMDRMGRCYGKVIAGRSASGLRAPEWVAA